MADFLITESDNFLITESDNFLILEFGLDYADARKNYTVIARTTDYIVIADSTVV